MVTFELDKNAVLTDHEKQQLSEAAKRPIVYDEDSPPLTSEMEKAFIAARRANPYRREPVTLYVSSATVTKAKSMGENYLTILGELLDKAVDEYTAS